MSSPKPIKHVRIRTYSDEDDDIWERSKLLRPGKDSVGVRRFHSMSTGARVDTLTIEESRKPVSSTPTDKQVAISITVSPPTPPIDQKKSFEYYTPDFDALFDNPSKLFKFAYGGDSIDEGIYSFDNGTGNRFLYPDDFSPASTPGMTRNFSTTSVGRVSRIDSVMEQSFNEMMAKNVEHSGGFGGFRRRMANEILHKYCSYCRCDEMIFIFLYVMFGMAYITAGTLGITQCVGERFVNLFLICDGVLSVFVFPITVMEWTQRIGGCVNEHNKLGSGVYFYLILIFRLAVAVIGSVLIASRLDVFPLDDVICWSVFTLLEIGVGLEWLFLLFALVLPYVVYVCLFIVAKRTAKDNTNDSHVFTA